MSISALVLALAAIAASDPNDADPSWRFVVPPPGDSFETPPPRALALSREKPDDLVVNVKFRGTRQRDAQLRFGSPSSVRVTILLDELGRGSADLYVDANRNRRIEESDRVQGSDRTWRVPLDVSIVEGETTRSLHRSAYFRLGATGITFSYAAAGYLEGHVLLAGRRHAARRSDGDGNGSLTDPQDRLWIDLNDDARWDPASEQFLFASILSVGDSRYAARSDPFGKRLSLDVLEGTGTIRLALAGRKGQPEAVELVATLIGRDGSAVGLSGEQARATLPIGEYRLGTVTCAFEAPDGGPRWNFVFSDIGRRGDSPWYKLERDATVTIDPIGKLELKTGADLSKPIHPGDDIRVQPELYTSDGLLIVTSYRGALANPASDTAATGARIQLQSHSGLPLATAHSGFA